MIAHIRAVFHSSNSRNQMLCTNILLSAGIKVVGLLTSLLIVPATLGYLAPEQYGVWMTISSILVWFSFFDVGMGNGMRNYLTQAISEGDFKKGRIYLSTTLAMLAVIAVVLAVVAMSLACLFDLNKVFNTTLLDDHQLRMALLIAIVFTLVMFVVKNIGLVYVALQQYAMNDFLIVLGNVLALIFIFVLTKVTEGSLINVVLVFTVIPVLTFVLAAIPLFRRHENLRPSLSSVNLDFGRQILGKGLGFFFIQITSCLIIFGGSNMIITQFLGPEAVTTYNIAYKYFNLLAIAYTVVIAPMWNAYTDASVKGDTQWIQRTFRRALMVWLLSVVGGLPLLAVSGMFYKLWIGDAVTVPFMVSASVFAYISLFNLNNCATMLINGLNKIGVQIITSVVVTVAYLIVVIAFGGKLGIEGVVMCMAGSYAVMSIIHLYQCHLFVHGKARGIWNR